MRIRFFEQIQQSIVVHNSEYPLISLQSINQLHKDGHE